MASEKYWRILYSYRGKIETLIVEARDRRAARETFLAENPDIAAQDISRTVLVPE